MKRKPLKSIVQRQAYQMVGLQLKGVVLIALIALILRGAAVAGAVLAGGLAYGVSNLIFVWGVFRFTSNQQMTQFLAAFFLGEAFKLLFSAFLVIMIVKQLPHSLLSVLVGFVGAIVSFWVACIWSFARKPAAISENNEIQ